MSPGNSSAPASSIRQARDILAKWSSSDLLDQISALPPIPPMPTPHISAVVERPSKTLKDSAEPSLELPSPLEPVSSSEPVAQQVADKPDAVVTGESDLTGQSVEEDWPPSAVQGMIEPAIDSASPVAAYAADDAETPAQQKSVTAESKSEAAEDSAASFEFEDFVPSELIDEELDAAEISFADFDVFEDQAAALASPPSSEPPKKPQLVITVSPVEKEIPDSQPPHRDDVEQNADIAENTHGVRISAVETAKQPKSKVQADAVPRERASAALDFDDITSLAPVAIATMGAAAVGLQTTENQTDEQHTAAVTPDAATTRTPQTKQRAKQERPVQQRKRRGRKHSPAFADKGSTAVAPKFRIDTKDGGSAETPQQPAQNVAGSRIQGNASPSGRRHRIDDAEPVEEVLGTGDARVRTQNRPRRRYIDEAHDDAVRGPHFQVTAPKRSNVTSMTGHFLAYLGVLGLTIGTGVVICGHFGGYSEYTPMGWLVTTVAQMILFLGVINLVSGGIEQTNDDVSARINTLGEQLFRIEQVTEEALRGPKINAARYANPDANVEESQQVVVGTRER